MTARFPGTGHVLDSIAMLYELSLDVGTSLELVENCDVFLKKLMARRNLSFCGLYLDPKKLGQAADAHRAVYTFPAHKPGDALASLPDAVVRRAQDERSFCCLTRDLGAADDRSFRSAVGGGVASAFAVSDFGVVLCVSQVRSALYERWQLVQLHALFDKFAASIDACLEHAHLVRETATRLELQEKLATAKRLESLGLLAGGVAHDLNNLLGPILLYPGIIRDGLPADSSINSDLMQIEQSAQRAAEVVQSLLAVARNSQKNRGAPIDLAPVVRGYFDSAAFRELAIAMPRVKVGVQVESDHPILGTECSIVRVVMNLVANAFEAMRGEGQLQVRLSTRVVDATKVSYEAIPAGSYSVLTVADTGRGIAPPVIGRIFEPFFSTKETSRSGTGLGLSVVYGLVKELGGYVDVWSSPTGTTFELLFPRRSDSGSTMRDPLVFIVDDQPAQAEAAARIVSDLKLDVATFTRGVDAMAALGRQPGLALVDLVLGNGESGVQLYAAMRRRCPDLRGILMSGFTDPRAIEQGLQHGASIFLRKPYTAGELQQAIRGVVGLHPPAVQA